MTRVQSLFRALPGLILLTVAVVQNSFALSRQKFDFVVGVDGDFKAAVATAKAAGGKRFLMFFPDGEYNAGSLTGDANQMTTFTTSNVSFIGQSSDKTVIYNKSINEGISITATLFFNKANNLYLQDLTLFNKAVYGNTAQYNVTGRHAAVMEQGDKIIYKNVKLKSTQDTYYTKSGRTYWEGGEIHGTTDFICGGGDVYFNKVLLWEMKVSAITASQTNSSWGYVFNECTVDGTVSGTALGRSWGDARVVFLRTIMNKLPSAAGWGDPMNSVPKVFAEYKSVTSSGAAVDLSKRRTSYTKDAITVTLDPVLSDAEAAKYTVTAVVGGTDNWQPQVIASQVTAPVVTQVGSTLSWNDDAKALCWAIFKGDKYLANVTTNRFEGTGLAKGDIVTVRAANEMGGLGPSSAPLTFGTASQGPRMEVFALHHEYRHAGRMLRLRGEQLGTLKVSLFSLDGSFVLAREFQGLGTGKSAEISLSHLRAGVYFLNYTDGSASWTGSVDLW
ncbi:MAG: hypothetical protein IPN71_11350 [Fibrobacteres bacterium]|nr:hypothetical protein [Fibrobacterota bacterium]